MDIYVFDEYVLLSRWSPGSSTRPCSRPQVKSIDKIVVTIGRPKSHDAMERYVQKDYVAITIRTRDEGLSLLLNSLNDPERFVPIQDLRVGGGKATTQGRQRRR